MAENFQNTVSATTNSFNKGMVKDFDSAYTPQGIWTHARNAINNTNFGQVGVIGNEPANLKCLDISYTIIGAISKTEGKWVVFNTNDTNSEIGIFDETKCSYKKLVNADCLNFKTTNLITGVVRSNFDCTESVYFSDGLNPDRVLNLDKIPYIEKKQKSGPDCKVPEYTDQLDCEALRLAPLFKTPCVSLQKADSGGNLANGSYQVAIAYAVNSIRVTDYVGISNVQSLFDHAGIGGGLELSIESMDADAFDEFELVVIATVFQNTNARSLGFYSTRTKKVMIDKYSESLPVVPLSDIPMLTPAYEKSDAIYEVNNYLMRTGIYTKFDINYQPQANKILSKWVSAQVPSTYYNKGGNLTSYMRDEVYSFFIRWVYNTGEKTASYHIPGRASTSSDLGTTTGEDALESNYTDTPSRNWQVYDTSDITSTTQYPIPSIGATVIAEGTMSYWESTEKYPDNRPDIWDNLCGKPIRHHKFPDNCTTHINSDGGKFINLLGVKFDNISHPLDNYGNPITSIVGYEILRGSREGNKTIIAKGMINNMGEYDIDSDISSRKGLYQNYPYNDLRIDPFLSKKEVKGGCDGKGYTPMGTFRRDVFSFHSPETQFRDPYLSPFELKIHGELNGTTNGRFLPVYKHPEHKLIRDQALFISGLVGAGIAVMMYKGTMDVITKKQNPSGSSTSGQEFRAGQTITATNPSGNLTVTSGLGNIGGSSNSITNETPFSALGTAASTAMFSNPITGPILWSYYTSVGMEQSFRIMQSFAPYRQYAYQYNSHGDYSNYLCPIPNNRRRHVLDAQYVNPYLQDLDLDKRINNLYRNRFVAVTLDRTIDDPKVIDDSRTTIGNLRLWDNPSIPFSRTISAYYASLKVSQPAQYGQLSNIIQIPVSTCVTNTSPVKDQKYTSPVLFGGDIYINRYTEKNSFFFFNDWLFNDVDGARFDYMKYVNIPYPRYWVDTNDINFTNLVQPFASAVASYMGTNFIAKIIQDITKNANSRNATIARRIISLIAGAASFTVTSLQSWRNKVLPNDYRHLDRYKCGSKFDINIDNAYFYLFANGVRDFFVESEINLAQRDWGELMSEQFYDPYRNTDLASLFRSDIIKSGNYYKYDYSLSYSRLVTNNLSWASILPTSYDPKIAETCYSYYPQRAVYSLPQTEELKKDNWRVYLANNYKDFDSKITAIKSINQSGAMMLMHASSPVMFPGVDQLQTQNGIKVTIGDSGLFAGNLQNLSNAESVYEQGACQSRRAVINTPAGLFWVSQNQGKVFQFSQGMKEISRDGMKWWFAKYLPSYIMTDYPEFELYDNAVSGVGVMLSYDNTNDLLYITKKDYRVKDEYKDTLKYDSKNIFRIGRLTIELGNPTYFEDASFTISYDVKSQSWMSFHDWHPNLMVSSRNHFMTIVQDEIWKHNERCDLFCNFYGKDYPFEVEYLASTGQEVTTLKNIEYQLECYKYDNHCRDVNHVLDFNFDQAVVFNTEQVSGVLKMIEKQKNDPLSYIQYPAVGQNQITIQCSKEENKYRFNQFWDITRNRGEFNPNFETIWDTAANGYVKEINSNYVTYAKSPLQRKKFRHYMSRVLLKRLVSGEYKMLFRLSNNKVTKSFR